MSYTWVLAARIWSLAAYSHPHLGAFPFRSWTVGNSSFVWWSGHGIFCLGKKPLPLQLSTRWWQLSFHHYKQIDCMVLCFSCVMKLCNRTSETKIRFSLKYHGTASLQKLIQNLPFPFPRGRWWKVWSTSRRKRSSCAMDRILWTCRKKWCPTGGANTVTIRHSSENLMIPSKWGGTWDDFFGSDIK